MLAVPASSHGAGIDAFVPQPVMGIGKIGQNVVVADAGVVGGDLGLTPAVGQQANDEFDRQARAANNRLTRENRRIENNAVSRSP